MYDALSDPTSSKKLLFRLEVKLPESSTNNSNLKLQIDPAEAKIIISIGESAAEKFFRSRYICCKFCCMTT